MADSPAFDWTCEAIERATELDRLESRGTVRIALKSAGFESSRIRPDQMQVVIERVLPAELTARGVPDAQALCARVAARIRNVGDGEGEIFSDSPDEVFRRLGDS